MLSRRTINLFATLLLVLAVFSWSEKAGKNELKVMYDGRLMVVNPSLRGKGDEGPKGGDGKEKGEGKGGKEGR